MPMHAPLQQHPNVAPLVDSNGYHLLARKTRVPLEHCAACSEQWHAPPFTQLGLVEHGEVCTKVS